jgi:hypothetical protein
MSACNLVGCPCCTGNCETTADTRVQVTYLAKDGTVSEQHTQRTCGPCAQRLEASAQGRQRMTVAIL